MEEILDLLERTAGLVEGTAPTATDEIAAEITAHVGELRILDDNIRALSRGILEFSRQCQEKLQIYREAHPELITSLAHALFSRKVRDAVLLQRDRPRRVLVLGETGTGKERIGDLIARVLCALSDTHTRDDTKVLTVNAATFSEEFFLSELFGHEKGAFTGATTKRTGIAPDAHPLGCVVLDEIGEMHPVVQAQVLRFAQDGRYRPLGANRESTANVHIVSITNRNDSELKSGSIFRSDLYYRLASNVVKVPPLRTLLASSENAFQRIFGILITEVEQELFGYRTADSQSHFALAARDPHPDARKKEVLSAIGSRFRNYDWPGNLREAHQLMMRAHVEGSDAIQEYPNKISAEDARDRRISPTDLAGGLKGIMESHERLIFEHACANCSTIEDIARKLKITRQTVSRKLQKYGLRPQGLRASRL